MTFLWNYNLLWSELLNSFIFFLLYILSICPIEIRGDSQAQSFRKPLVCAIRFRLLLRMKWDDTCKMLKLVKVQLSSWVFTFLTFCFWLKHTSSLCSQHDVHPVCCRCCVRCTKKSTCFSVKNRALNLLFLATATMIIRLLTATSCYLFYFLKIPLYQEVK